MRFEHWWYTLPLRMRSIFSRQKVESELEEELRFHLDHLIEEGVARGLSPREARRRALLAMGGPELKKEEIRDMRRLNWLTDFVADLRFAARSLRRTPVLTTLVVVTLALGIGMTATPFAMVDALVFRPYPVPDPEEVVTLVGTTRDTRTGLFSYREYLDLRDQTRSYRGVVASTAPRSVGFAADARATPKIAGGVLVSGNYFDVLGVEPALGRGFHADEDRVPGRDAVVVLGHGFWRRELAADAAVVGRTVRLNGTDFTVVGVLPESFPGMAIFARPDVFVPLAMAGRFSTSPDKDFFEARDARELRVMGRLAPTATLADARTEIAGLAEAFARDAPVADRGRGADVRTAFQMRTRGDDQNWKFGVVFSVLALAMLLVACTNVAGILLSRARTRTREVAVRLALGAGRSRLVRLLLAESLLLSLVGAVGGVAVGYAGISYMQRFSIPAELPVTIPFRLDVRVLVASLVVAALSAMLCGLAPALRSTRADLVTGLKAADVEPPGRKRLWGRSALVVAQVAMSLMLLASTLVMARSFRQEVEGGVGFPKEDLLLVRFDPRLVQYDAPRTRQFFEQLTARVRQAPGVRGAALMQNPPLGLGDFDSLAFAPDAYQMPLERDTFAAPMDTVDEGYFTTMGIAIPRGRGFLAGDTAESPPVAVVNEAFAARYWPNGDAIGKVLWLDGRRDRGVEIVGVARTVKYVSAGELPVDFVYLPLAQRPQARLVLAVRTAGDPLAMVDPVREIVRSLDPNLPMLETRTWEDLYRYHAVEGPGVAIELVGSLGAVGLALTIAGLYGLVAYNVSRRTREIGIRMAIGAGPLAAFRLVVGNGLTLVGIGTAVGLTLGFAVERLMDSTLFNTPGVDVVAYLVVVPSMLLVTLVATFLPARRAARIPPTQALRYE
jgi:macrolide transport system ATP-binding/permease protein